MAHDDDRRFMQRALELAERGRGHVEPNPLVGAVLVDGRGNVVGEGWHERYGAAHAEINAIARAGSAARGATLYVTLEPCCHHGKTPPCTQAVIAAGVKRVVAALQDPFPQVAGRGAAELAAAGIPIAFGTCGDEARRQNAPYLKRLATGLPYVHLKWAMSLDGKIATSRGASRWISNESSRRRVHELRGRMDAIVIGIGTALADDPLLTARPPGPRVACRVVLDSHARLPLDSQLVRTAHDIPTQVVVAGDIDTSKLAGLQGAGCVTVAVPTDEQVRLDIAAYLRASVAADGWTNVLVEGGAEVLGSFLDRRLVDEVHVFLAPILVGSGKPAVAGRGVETIAEGLRLARWTTENLDGDVYLHGVP